MTNKPKPGKLDVSNLWGEVGITEHWGGVNATRRLIDLCAIKPGQRILYLGCGTGYTPCLLAKSRGVRVTAVDISVRILELAKKRVKKEHVGEAVALVNADAQQLPFRPDAFDAVIAESVLIFCDAGKVNSEAYRVLKPGGVIGINEATYFQIPPERLRTLLLAVVPGVTIQPLLEDEWRSAFRKAGFTDVSSTIYRFDPWEQFKSHLEVDGLWSYLSSSVHSFADPAIRGLFFNKAGFEFMRLMLRHTGYGLYASRKPRPCHVDC